MEASKLSQALTATSREPDAVLRVFTCYRRQDGAWLAEWLHQTLHGERLVDARGTQRVIEVYYDVAAPGVPDWKKLHFPSLQASHALVLVCTPGVSKDLSRRGHPDWVYEELKWWIRNRRYPPIVLDTTGEGERWLPELVLKRWPNLNRLSVDQEDLALHVQGDAKRESIRRRVIATLKESEQATVFEDLERLRKLSKRLIGSLVLSIALLLIAIGTTLFALNAKIEAERSTKQAREQFERAERQTALATAQAWKLYRRAIADKSVAVTKTINPDEYTRATDGALLSLIDQTIRNKEDADSAIYAIKILMCFGPHKGKAKTIAFNILFNTFMGTENSELRRQLDELQKVVSADQQGIMRPRSSATDRCDWMRPLRE